MNRMITPTQMKEWVSKTWKKCQAEAWKAALAERNNTKSAEQVKRTDLEPVAKVIATAPNRIWLDLGFDPADEDITFDQLFEATWSQDNATGWGIEYVRADLAAPPQRKPLSEEEIKRIDNSTYFHESPDWSLRFARAIERAHGVVS